MPNAKVWIQTSYLFLAFLAWLLIYHVSDLLWDLAGSSFLSDGVVTVPQIIATIAAVGAFAVFQRSAAINQFSGEVASELAKVTWPEVKETVLSTGVIVVMVAIATLILAGFDVVLGTVSKWFYR